MCGLVGIAAVNFTNKDKGILHDLLHLDVFRGKHSTGVAIINDLTSKKWAPDCIVAKSVGEPSNLYHEHDYLFKDRYLLAHQLGTNIVMGHNRAATQGKVIVENAHPFDMGSIVGVHNGTVQPYSIEKLLPDHISYDVDSQIIFHHLSATKDLQSLWDVANGALTLNWWDKDESTLNFATNGKRDFHYVWGENGALYWASEDWMLYVALSRNDVKMKCDPISLHKDQHHKFKIIDDKIEHTWTDLEPYVDYGYGEWASWGFNTSRKKSSTHLRFQVEDVVDLGGEEYYAVGKSVPGGKTYRIDLGPKGEVNKKRKERIIKAGRDQVYVAENVNWTSVDTRHFFGEIDWLDVRQDIPAKPANNVIEMPPLVEDDIPFGTGNVDTLYIHSLDKSITQQVWENVYDSCCFCFNQIPWSEAPGVEWLNDKEVCCIDCRDFTSNSGGVKYAH